MKIYTCEKCMAWGPTCETTTPDDWVAPKTCPYGVPNPEWEQAYGKEGKNALP